MKWIRRSFNEMNVILTQSRFSKEALKSIVKGRFAESNGMGYYPTAYVDNWSDTLIRVGKKTSFKITHVTFHLSTILPDSRCQYIERVGTFGRIKFARQVCGCAFRIFST